MEQNNTTDYTSDLVDNNSEHNTQDEIQSEQKNNAEIQGQLLQVADADTEENAAEPKASESSPQENQEPDFESGPSESAAQNNGELKSNCDETEPLMSTNEDEDDLFVEHLCDEMFACLMNAIQNNPEKLYGHDSA